MGLLIGAACISAAAAHHSFPATYDMESTAEIEGAIESLEWRNPHVLIGLRAMGGDYWRIELDAIGALDAAGLSPRRLRVGTHVRIAGYPARSGIAQLYASHILLEGRREYLVRPAVRPRWPDSPD